MRLVVYLAGAICSFALFLLSLDYRSEATALQYLGYVFILLTFFFLLMGIRDYTQGRESMMEKRKRVRMEKRDNYREKIRKVTGR